MTKNVIACRDRVGELHVRKRGDAYHRFDKPAHPLPCPWPATKMVLGGRTPVCGYHARHYADPRPLLRADRLALLQKA